MKKTLLMTVVSAVVLSGAAFATQILETKPTTEVKRPVVRPSLTKILDKRPALPGAKSNTGSLLTGKVQPPLGTGKIIPMGTGSVKPTTGSVVKQIVQQNAEDVKAYREENGYIIRYLKKAATTEEKKTMNAAVEKAIKTLLAEQKTMRESLQKNGTGTITGTDWLNKGQIAVQNYKNALLPYIDTAKLEDFDKFITGRINLFNQWYINYLIILHTKAKQNQYDKIDDSSSVLK